MSPPTPSKLSMSFLRVSIALKHNSVHNILLAFFARHVHPVFVALVKSKKIKISLC